MDEDFMLEGYHFKRIKEVIADRPYRVKCIETQETKDSPYSLKDAAEMIVHSNNAMKKNLEEMASKDRKYVKHIFEKILVGKRKCECNASIEKNMGKTRLANNNIIFVCEKDGDIPRLIYKTDYFCIMVLFRYGFQHGATEIDVTDKEAK